MDMSRRVIAYPVVLAVAALAAIGTSALGLAGTDWYVAGVAALVVTVATTLVWSEDLRIAAPPFLRPVSIRVDSPGLEARFSVASDANMLRVYQQAFAAVARIAAEAIKEQADTARAVDKMLSLMQALIAGTTSTQVSNAHITVGSAIATGTGVKISHVVGDEPVLRAWSRNAPWIDEQALPDLIRSSLDLHSISDPKVYVYKAGEIYVFVTTDFALTVEQETAMPLFTSLLDIYYLASTALIDARENADH